MLCRNQALRYSDKHGLTSTMKAEFAVWFAAQSVLVHLSEGQQDWLFFECVDNCSDAPTVVDDSADWYESNALSVAKDTFAGWVDTTDFTTIPGGN